MPRKNRRLIYSGNGDAYYIHPSAIGASELNVIFPETFITANPDDVARGNAQRWWREHGNVYGEKGLEQVSPEFDLIGLAPLVKPVVNNIGKNITKKLINRTSKLLKSVEDNPYSYKSADNPFTKYLYNQKISGKGYSLVDNGFSSEVTKGLTDAAKEELRHNTIERNAKFFRDNGVSDEVITAYKNKANSLLDDVNVGRYSGLDYQLAGMEETGGFYDNARNFISVNRDSSFPANFVEKHEGRHLLDYKLDDGILTGDDINDIILDDWNKYLDYKKLQHAKQKQNMILGDAYDGNFLNIPNTKYADSLEGYPNMAREAVTTNRDARDVLFNRSGFNNAPIEEQNRLIDIVDDDEIIAAIESANGYGRRYIDLLEDSNLLSPDKIKQFREAMKYVGINAIPLGIGLRAYNLNKKRLGGRVRLADGGYVRKRNNHPIAFDTDGNLVDQITGEKGYMPLPEVSVVANPDDVARGRAQRWFEEFNVNPNDRTSISNGRPQNQYLEDKAERGASQAASWMRENQGLNLLGMGLGAIPFAVASYPLASTLPSFKPIISGGRNLLTPGSSFWTNPITRNVMKSTAAGMSADTALKLTTGKSYGEGMSDVIHHATGLNPANNPISQFAVDMTNPFYMMSELPALVNSGKQFVTNAPNNGKRLVDNLKKTYEKQIEFAKDLHNPSRQFDRLHRLEDLARERNDYFYRLYNREADKYKLLQGKIRKEKDKLMFNWDTEIYPATLIPRSHKLQRISVPNFDKMSADDVEKFFSKTGLSGVGKLFDENTKTFVSRTTKSTQPFNATKVVNTGKGKITNFKTGETEEFELNPDILNNDGQLTTYDLIYNPTTNSTSNRIVSSVNNGANGKEVAPQVPQQFAETVRQNMNYVTNDILPGSKPFGSTTNVLKGNLYHSSHDYDVIMTEAQAKANKNFDKFYVKRPGATYGYDDPVAGELDVNIIQENNGKAVGPLAHELYAQLYPKEYRNLMMKEAASGRFMDSSIELDKTAKELLDAYDPVQKGIVDAFASDKSKHIGRAYYYLNYGKVDDVRKGFDSYANYILGGDWTPTKIPLSDFSNAEVNSKFIDELGLKGINKTQFVNNPERMKLLFDYYVFDKSFVGRGVPRTYDGKVVNPIESLTVWNPNTGGGTANGVGLNTVIGGNSGHDSYLYGSMIPERSKSLDVNSVNDVMGAISKNIRTSKLSDEEVNAVKSIADKLNINLYNLDKRDNVTLQNVLQSTAGYTGENYKQFIAELGKYFDLPLLTNNHAYNEAAYASLLEDQSPSSIKQLFIRDVDKPQSISQRESRANYDVFDSGLNFDDDVFTDIRGRIIGRKYKADSQAISYKPHISREDLKREALGRHYAMADKRYRELKNKAFDIDDNNFLYSDKFTNLRNNVVKYVNKLYKIRRNITGGTAATALGGGSGTILLLGAKATKRHKQRVAEKEKARQAKYNSENYRDKKRYGGKVRLLSAYD